MANDFYRVEVARDGTLTVTDLRSGTRHRGLHRLEDEPDLGDLYNFCPVEGAAIWRSDSKEVEVRSRVLRDGLVSELELMLVARLPRGLESVRRVACRIRTVVRLVAGIDRIELQTEVDNRARDHRLRVVFPAPDAGDVVRAESQFAVVERPLVPPAPRTEWVEPPNTTQHTLGAVALGELALLTKGLPEYEARGRPGAAELALTLLRCVGVLSRRGGELATRPRGAGPSTPTPGGQCLGRHRFEYALRLGAASLDEASLLQASQDYRYDLLAGPSGSTPAKPLHLSGDPVAFSCLKGAEDGEGVVLRLYNPGRRSTRVRIDAGRLTRSRLDETDEQSVRRATLRSGEIGTFRLR